MTSVARWSVLTASALMASFGLARSASAQNYCTGCQAAGCATECQNPDTYEWTTCAQFTGCQCLPSWYTTSDQVVGVTWRWINNIIAGIYNIHVEHQVDAGGCYPDRDICRWGLAGFCAFEETCDAYSWGAQACPVQ